MDIFDIERYGNPNPAPDPTLYILADEDERKKLKIIIHSVDPDEIPGIVGEDFPDLPHAVIANGVARKYKSRIVRSGYGDDNVHIVVARTASLIDQALSYTLTVYMCEIMSIFSDFFDTSMPISIVGPNPWPDVTGRDIVDDVTAAIEADKGPALYVLPHRRVDGCALADGMYPGDTMYCLSLFGSLLGFSKHCYDWQNRESQ